MITSDIRTKAVAIEKATYLHSLGFNMNWASFHVVELMSTQNVKYKRVGYLAATQSFGDDTDVVLLIPNLLKKDLASPNPAEAALAISCLGNIVTPELSQTLVADVYSLLNNHKPELRRRACLCLYKCFLRYPEALRPSFARLTECLEDDDQTVVQAAVTVLSELAMHNPKTYLPLAPKFYKLLTTSSSNWMTIKLVKVFGALTPLEPRLAKKLVGPLSEILETTSAKSLLYECIRTVVAGMTSQEKIVRQAVDKLKDMLEDNDPNIKFLALHALTFLLESHPRIVAEHKGNIFGCVDHEDSNIQYCALKIVRGLVTKKTLMDTTAHLMGAMGKADQRFRDELVWSVIHVCMNDRYALVTDFVWYLTVLADLVRVPSSSHGGLVGDQLIDICLRVEVVRESAVAILKPLLLDPSLLENTASNATVAEALKSIAWIVGEYAHFVADHDEVVAALSHPNVANLPPHVQAVYVQSLLKVYASAVAAHAGAVRPPPEAPEPAPAPFDDSGGALALAAPGDAGDDAAAAAEAAAAAARAFPDTELPRSDVLVPMSPSLARLGDTIKENLGPFSVSLHLEVRERACQLRTILDIASAAEAGPPRPGGDARRGRRHRRAVRGGALGGGAARVAQGAAQGGAPRVAVDHRAALRAMGRPAGELRGRGLGRRVLAARQGRQEEEEQAQGRHGFVCAEEEQGADRAGGAGGARDARAAPREDGQLLPRRRGGQARSRGRREEKEEGQEGRPRGAPGAAAARAGDARVHEGEHGGRQDGAPGDQGRVRLRERRGDLGARRWGGEESAVRAQELVGGAARGPGGVRPAQAA